MSELTKNFLGGYVVLLAWVVPYGFFVEAVTNEFGNGWLVVLWPLSVVMGWFYGVEWRKHL